jgi:hypothetical protein
MTDHTGIEQLINALNAATKLFVDSDEDEPTHLYIDRTKDGEWSAVFCRCTGSDPLDAEMTRWTTGEDAIHTLALCQSGHARDVAVDIVTGWDSEWDS